MKLHFPINVLIRLPLSYEISPNWHIHEISCQWSFEALVPQVFKDTNQFPFGTNCSTTTPSFITKKCWTSKSGRNWPRWKWKLIYLTRWSRRKGTKTMKITSTKPRQRRSWTRISKDQINARRIGKCGRVNRPKTTHTWAKWTPCTNLSAVITMDKR